MENFEKLMEIIHKHHTRFTISRNYFQLEGLSLEDELTALYEDGDITNEIFESCMGSGELWYIEFFPEDRDGHYEVFGSTLREAVNLLIHELEDYYNVCSH